MEITWHPGLVRVFKWMCNGGTDDSCLGGIPPYAAGLACSLYSAIGIPVVSMHDIELPAVADRYAPRTLETVAALASWAVHIIRHHRANLTLAGFDASEVVRLKEMDPRMWSFTECASAASVLWNELVEVNGLVDHELFPGSPDKTVLAFQENLLASMAFIFLNEMLYSLDSGDTRSALTLYASATEFEREALLYLHQRVGHMSMKIAHRQDMRENAKKAHSEHYAMKQQVFAWLDGNMANFKSMDGAADAIAGKVVPIGWRTARDWVGQWKKLRSAGTP